MCPLPLRGRPVRSSRGLTGGQRRRLLRDVNGACNALNWMHGEDSRSAARLPSLVATEDKNQCLRADVQQRVILAAVRWVDADNAVDEHEALAKLLKGRTGDAPGVSASLIPLWTRRHEMLPAEARFLLEEFQSRMLLPPEVAAVIQDVRGEPGCHNDPRLLRRILREEEEESPSAHRWLPQRKRSVLVLHRLWSCCLETGSYRSVLSTEESPGPTHWVS